jgi:hypothetical protein
VVRVHEEAQPEQVGAARTQDRDGVAGLATVAEHAPGLLDPLQRRDVGAAERRHRGRYVHGRLA